MKRILQRWTWLADTVFLVVMAGALVRPIYRAEYFQSWASIESTFISDARYLSDHWPRPLWQPNWYGGTRFDYIYPPALRYGTAAIARAKDYSTARAYHIYIYALYVIGIAGVYWLVRAGSRSRWVGVWAAVATAMVSPNFLLFHEMAKDAAGVRYMPLRLGVLIRYGEGPHMSALALLGLALAASWYGLRKGNPGRLALAALFAALVVSNNFYGATALAQFFPLMAWAVWLAERDRWVWVRAAAVAAIAWGLCASWLTPSYLRITMANMELVSARGHGWSAALGAVVVAALAWATYRLAWGRPERAWTVWVLGSLVVFGLNVAGNQFFDFRVIGEPGRLIPELDLVILMSVGLLFGWLAKKGRWWGQALATGLAVACLAPGFSYVLNAWAVLPWRSGYEERIEYQMTGWIHRNLPGVRVLATGSLRFWYNAWYELPQLGGGSEQGLLNPNTNYAHWHATVDDEPEKYLPWLQAMGVGAVAVHDKTSREVYHDWEKPLKFEGKLEKIFDDLAGNRMYTIPRRWPVLARVVDAGALRALKASPPEAPAPTVQRYADLLEKGPDAPPAMERPGPEEIVVKARLESGQALLVQESWDPAWQADVDGRDVKVTRDPLGQLLVEPGPGQHRVRLRFTLPLEKRIGIAATLLALVALAGLAVYALWGRRAARMA